MDAGPSLVRDIWPLNGCLKGEPTSEIIDVDASFIRNSETNLANGHVEEVLFCFDSLILYLLMINIRKT